MKKYIIIIFLIVLMVLTISCSKPIEDMSVDELLQTGEKYLADMKYEKAMVYFEHLIEIEPMNPRGYTGIAEAYSGIGQKENAVAAFSDGLDLFEEDIETSINFLEKLIELDKENTNWYIELAEIYIEAEELKNAEKILNAAISENGIAELEKENVKELLDKVAYQIEVGRYEKEAKPVIDKIKQYCSAGDYEPVIAILQSDDCGKILALLDLVKVYKVEMENSQLMFSAYSSNGVMKCNVVCLNDDMRVALDEGNFDHLTADEWEYVNVYQTIDNGHDVDYVVDGILGVNMSVNGFNDVIYVKTGDHITNFLLTTDTHGVQ